MDAMPEGGHVTFALEQTPDAAVLKVRDTGSGVPPELHEKLFRPFFTTKTRGTGLGLSICKKILDAHEGSIRISSEPGRGTEVVLSLPQVS
jgi:signal transduction histidine kinase